MNQVYALADLDAHAARKIKVAGALLRFGAFQRDVRILERIGAAAVVFM